MTHEVIATTAREITAAVRELFPAPVRLSTRAAARPGYFTVTMPAGPAASLASSWGEGFMSRRLGQRVRVIWTRNIRRRDYGRDTEMTLRVTGEPGPGHPLKGLIGAFDAERDRIEKGQEAPR